MVYFKPIPRTIMQSVIVIEKRDQNVHVKKRSHASDSFFVYERLYMFKCNDLATRRPDGDAILKDEFFLCRFNGTIQSSSRKFGYHSPRCGVFLPSEFFRRLKHVIINF